jgi:hypothetical protein
MMPSSAATAGRARGFGVFDDRANRKRQQLPIIEATVA